MRKSTLIAAVSTLMLAACGGDAGSDGGESLSMEEVAEITQDSAIKPEPGQYSVTTEVLEVNIPGAPEGMADMMSSSMGRNAHSYCLSQDDVDNGFEEMAKQSQEGSDCTFERYDIDDGGDMDAKMVCNMQGQGEMTMTMSGTGSTTGSEMDIAMEGNIAGMGDMSMRMKVSHERTGDCT
ncbi:MAG: DUF3617 domain-containing protein [Erythrobacter sp.]